MFDALAGCELTRKKHTNLCSRLTTIALFAHQLFFSSVHIIICTLIRHNGHGVQELAVAFSDDDAHNDYIFLLDNNAG